MDDLLATYKLECSGDGDNKKVKCILTGHEMSYKESVVRAYVNGRRYKAATRHRNIESTLDLTQYNGLIVAHKTNDKQVFCIVTSRVLNKNSHEIAAHMSGRSYKAAARVYEERKKRGAGAAAAAITTTAADDDSDDDDQQEHGAFGKDAEELFAHRLIADNRKPKHRKKRRHPKAKVHKKGSTTKRSKQTPS